MVVPIRLQFLSYKLLYYYMRVKWPYLRGNLIMKGYKVSGIKTI